jgi:hypothetical protein
VVTVPFAEGLCSVKAEQRWPVAWAAGTTATLRAAGMPLFAAASRQRSRCCHSAPALTNWAAIRASLPSRPKPSRVGDVCQD